jgi:hypothetical protein
MQSDQIGRVVVGLPHASARIPHVVGRVGMKISGSPDQGIMLVTIAWVHVHVRSVYIGRGIDTHKLFIQLDMLVWDVVEAAVG